ncbi:cation diffusion facilitator family transporter [Palleronia sp. KMU-117]|uniref:cation diffusion facilitator family transporter n=1 Tax=Palleronia sp. KMU-117 TaxID=3434108 RepID=UPI003D721B57
MAHDHAHVHRPDPAVGDRRVLWAVIINLALTVVQVVAGIASGSLALIADAVHNLADAMSLVIAFAARKVARRPSDGDMTFGYGRVEVVAALVNYTTLIVIALYLASEAVMRFADPPGVEGWIVVAVAGVALLIDAATALLTWRLSKDSVNIRAAFLHNLTDALGSLAVIVAGSLILLYDWRLIDPIVTLGIAGYILWLSVAGIVPVARILMQASPDGVETDAVCAAIEAVPGVRSVHHLHLWQMDERTASLEAHVVLDGGGMGDAARVKDHIRARLQKSFGISHATLETELPDQGCPDTQRIGHADA